jgi:hypothetical protein
MSCRGRTDFVAKSHYRVFRDTSAGSVGAIQASDFVALSHERPTGGPR